MKLNNLDSTKDEALKAWEELKLSDNFLFQKFMLNKEMAKKILSEILCMEVEKIEYPEYEKTINLREDSKGIRLDVYIKGDNRVYNIEMQTDENEHIPKRSRYYQQLIDLDLLDKGATHNYKDLGTTFVIFICTFDYYKLGQYKYSFKNMCEEISGLELGDETRKIIINVDGPEGDVSEDFKAFCHAVKGEFSNERFSANIKNEIVRIKESREFRREFMTLYEKEVKKFEEGRAAGIEEGRAAGIEEGRAAEKKLAIENMAKLLSPEQIIEMGYDEQLVREIIK